MTIPIKPPLNTEEFLGNIIRPFQLESSSLRGRIVRFNTVLDDILTPHNYPKNVNQLLGEVVTLCSLLSSMLKFEGIFTLQISGDGPVSMLVADITSSGDIRGCASFDKERLAEVKDNTLAALLGNGYIVFTVDQGENTDRYQGIVELKGETLAECLEHYFSQSEQIKTGILLAVEQGNNKWSSAGLMLQQMPTDGGNEAAVELDVDDWQRSIILMESCSEKELLAPNLNSHAILLRLFHEEGVRVFEPTPLQHKCRCSQAKVENVFKMLSEEEREEMTVDGKMVLTCEFCSKEYEPDV